MQWTFANAPLRKKTVNSNPTIVAPPMHCTLELQLLPSSFPAAAQKQNSKAPVCNLMVAVGLSLLAI